MRGNRLGVLAAVLWILTATTGAQPIGDRVPLSFEVVHLHNTGECHGTLTIDKWKFSFESADRPEDSRAWKITEIDKVESRHPHELVLRTAESGKSTLGQGRNYKFRVLGAGIAPDIVAWMQDRVQ